MSEWIEWTWTEEKPYPETPETEVFIKYNGHSSFFSAKVKDWAWFTSCGVTHYRLA